MSSDLRIVQAARLLELYLPGLSPEHVRAAITMRPAEFALALVAEAANNDDVTSGDAARDYLQTRLGEFGDLVPPEAAEPLRAAFEQAIAGWEPAPPAP
ncbi:MAG: hypothetical protein ACR2HN_13715 [Tepidiformaceae bacterium]